MNAFEGCRERLVGMVAKLSDERAAEVIAILRDRDKYQEAEVLEAIRCKADANEASDRKTG